MSGVIGSRLKDQGSQKMAKSTDVAVMMKAFIVVWTFRYVQSAGSVLISYWGLSVYFLIHKSTTGV